MILPNKSAIINRLIIILISEQIYNNRTKINLLLTCKFIYSIIDDIYFYQEVKIRKIINLSILKRFTNINLNHYPSLIYIKLFDNVTKMTISDGGPEYLNNRHTADLRDLPVKLKKLEIFQACALNNNVELPQTLEILYLKCSLSHFPNNLKKLTLKSFPLNTRLPLSLTYLKFLDYIDDGFFINDSPITSKNYKLKTLILYDDYLNILPKYDPKLKLKQFNPNIKHLSLGSAFDNFSDDILVRIIPKNITHLETNLTVRVNVPACINILKEYSLTKLTLRRVNLLKDDHIKIIPLSVTSISFEYGNFSHHSNPDKLAFFLRKIPLNIRSLSINNYYMSMINFYPSNIIKLKIFNYRCTALPNSIEELYIENIDPEINTNYSIGSHIKKLNIKYSDRNRFIYNDGCLVTYRY